MSTASATATYLGEAIALWLDTEPVHKGIVAAMFCSCRHSANGKGCHAGSGLRSQELRA